MERLRILAIASRPFFPANTGGRIRSSEIFSRLARLHDVTLLCFSTDQDRPEDVEQMHVCCSTLETVPWHETVKFTPQFYRELISSFGSKLPYTVRKYRSREMRRRIRTRLDASDYDLLLCDFLQPSINCLDVTFRPKVLFQHNVEAVIRSRQAEHAAGPLSRAYLRLEAAKLARYERLASLAFDTCIMVSDDDCRVMRDRYGATNVVSVPTGVDIDRFTPAADGEAPEIVFVGSMDWLPNQDAVHFFIRDILPRIRRILPATFTIAGRNPPEEVRRYADSGYVRVTGTVADVRPFLARAQVCVVPLRIGGGTRIKIFEAMAMQKAVVSTSIGAEGLPLVHGEHLLIADSPEAFAEQVIGLMQQPERRLRLGWAAHQHVSSRYSWDEAVHRFSEICVATVNQSRTGGARPPSGRK